MLMPGEQTTTKITLLEKMPMMKGQTFTIRENRATVATGVITKILKSIPVDKKKLNKVEVPELSEVQSLKSR